MTFSSRTVSTDDQADKGYSLPSQLELCNKYAERLGYAVIAQLKEDYGGGTPITERPEGKRLAAMLSAREADAVIVYQVDRLSRDIVNLLATVQMWIDAGIEVHTCDIGRIESELDIVLVIKGWQGSDERKKFRERSMRGKRTKAQSGKVIACQPALGYRLVRDANGKAETFEIVEEEAKIVRLIFRWYSRGDEGGNLLSIRAIAARLSAKRMPTPREFKKGYMSLPQLKRENGIWNIAAVRDILSNEAYAGTWRYGKRIGNSSKQRPMDQTIAVKVPAIVDRETWERAQVMRERNAQFSRRNRKYEYLLSGLIRCGKCNLSYTGDKGNTRLYYRCSSRVHRFAKLEHFCHGQVRADVIEFDIWREIDELFSDLDGLEADLKAAQEEERDAQGPKREELKAVEALIERTDREVIEIAEALPKARGRVGEVLQAKMEEANARYEALLAQRDQLKAGLSTEKLTDAAIAEIMQYARAVQAGIIGADYITKRRFMEALGVKVFIQDGHYTLECVLGKAEGVISSVKRGGKIVIASKECSSSRCRRCP